MKTFVMILTLTVSSLTFAGNNNDLNQIQSARASCLKNSSSHVSDDVCEETAGKALDTELNAVYQAALKTMDSPTKVAFVQSERAWLAYRDAQVNYIGVLFTGGNGGGVAMVSKSNDLTAARIIEIQQ